MSSQYCQPSDLTTYGVKASALANVPPDVQSAACVASSVFADSKLRGRYSLPLISWDVDLTRATAIHAAYDLLVVRGYNPQAGSDANFRLRYTDALDWFNGIERQNTHPNVVPQPDQSPKYDAPQVFSKPPRGY